MPETRPLFIGNNQLYNDPDIRGKWDELKPYLREFLIGLDPNKKGSDALACDDMILWFRTLGFLDDPDFQRACEGFETSSFIRAKLYRIYTYCWAVRQAHESTGCYYAFDLGSYDGKTVQIADRYTDFKLTWSMFDMFEYHPAIENKGKHGVDLVNEVKERVRYAHVHPGLLPDTLENEPHGMIAFIHVDLNDGKTEISCLEWLYDRVAKGGVILLDDYGWVRYRESHDAHNAFFKSKGKAVLEMPTGQGLVIV